MVLMTTILPMVIQVVNFPRSSPRNRPVWRAPVRCARRNDEKEGRPLTGVAPPTHAGSSAPFERLLHESRDLFANGLAEALAGMHDKGEELLTTLELRAPQREARALYAHTRGLLRERVRFAQAFQVRWLEEFSRKVDHLHAPAEAPRDIDSQSLTLVTEDDLKETLGFRTLAGKLRRDCQEELAALDQRVGVLLGDANLAADANPFDPQTVGDAYRSACQQLSADAKVREVLLKLFDDHVADAVRALYQKLNASLVDNAILPKIRYGLVRQKDAPSKEDGAPKAHDAEPSNDYFAALQALMAKAGAGVAASGGSQGAPLVQGEALLESLTRLQLNDAELLRVAQTANVLHRIKAAELGRGLAQIDAMTLDIVAMLFDQLFEEPKIPNGVKGLIGRLQIPVLKVAIADKAFFSSKAHPARLLLDTLGEIALKLPPDFDASDHLFGSMEAIVDHLLEEFRDDTAIFDEARERFSRLLAEEESRVQREAGVAARKAEEAERLAVAKAAAERELGVRVKGSGLPAPVAEFLVRHWLKVLLTVHARRGPQSEAWKNALETIDELVWSVRPHTGLEERRKLAALVPALLKRLTAGLKLAGVSDTEREAFFARLLPYHAEGMGSAAARSGAPSQPPAEGPPPPAPAFAPNVVVKDPFGSGEVQVTDLDFTTRGAASPAAVPAELVVGSWVEFSGETREAPRRVAQLIFVSPRRTRYVFARGGAGKDNMVLTRAEIAAQFRAGRARVLTERPQQPLFERIMGNVLGKMRATGVPG
jgi:hypothetical protein